MEHLGELLSLFVAVLWTATALFADVASHRLGALGQEVTTQLDTASLFRAHTTHFVSTAEP